MNGQYPGYSGGPMLGLIKFLAIVGILTIFGLGVAIGIALAGAGF